MKNAAVSIPYDPDKLDAIRQFTPQDKPEIEAELTVTLDRLYEKRVPQPVKKYIEGRAVKPD